MRSRLRARPDAALHRLRQGGGRLARDRGIVRAHRGRQQRARCGRVTPARQLVPRRASRLSDKSTSRWVCSWADGLRPARRGWRRSRWARAWFDDAPVSRAEKVQ
jgi:hypothetical protein